MVFNFFMIIPAMVYASMLFSAVIASMILYVMGIVITAGSLSGIEHFKVNLPSHHYHATVNDEDPYIRSHSRDGVKVDISSSGIVVEDQESASANLSANSAASASAASAPVAVATMADVKVASASITAIAPGRVEVDVENKLRHYNALQGIGIFLGGIALFLLSLLMTEYTFIGFKNYVQWNISLLRLPVNA